MSKFSMEEISSLKGERLRIHQLKAKISIKYETSPEALALQWLEKATRPTKRIHIYLLRPTHPRSEPISMPRHTYGTDDLPCLLSYSVRPYGRYGCR